jgi:hypothetical protein
LRRLPEVVSGGAIDQLALEGGGTCGFPTADTGKNVEGPQRVVLPRLPRGGWRPPARAAGEAAVILTLLAVVVLLGAAASVAAWIPARRAASIDPVTALSAE